MNVLGEGKFLLCDFNPASGLSGTLRGILKSSLSASIESVEIQLSAFGRPDLARLVAQVEPDVTFLILSARELRQSGMLFNSGREANLPTPILVVTDEGEPRELSELLSAGVTDFVMAPLRALEILLRVWRLLEKTRTPHRAAASFDNSETKEAFQRLVGRNLFGDQGGRISTAVRRDSEVLFPGETFPSLHDPGFLQQGEYWSVAFEGHVARFKSTRGLHWLVCLLRHPGQEFHVSDLRAGSSESPVAARPSVREDGLSLAVPLHAACPMLDPRAKAEYKRCLEDLRIELEEAERFNDPERATKARSEINEIVMQLASAVGLGGRDRPTGSEAERARSAITKRIKESILKIGDVIPSLGRHLAARIKTGYFCSYNPDPDRPVLWRF